MTLSVKQHLVFPIMSLLSHLLRLVLYEKMRFLELFHTVCFDGFPELLLSSIERTPFCWELFSAHFSIG